MQVYKGKAVVVNASVFLRTPTNTDHYTMMKLVVLSCLMAAASAGLLTPYAPFAPLAYSGAYISPYYGSNYRGPLSLAPGQPANILAADGRPLDTLDVNLDRSAHLTAKALDGGIHLLKKRSAQVIAPLGGIAYAGAPLISHAAPLAYSAPILASYRTPIAYNGYNAGLYPYGRIL